MFTDMLMTVFLSLLKVSQKPNIASLDLHDFFKHEKHICMACHLMSSIDNFRTQKTRFTKYGITEFHINSQSFGNTEIHCEIRYYKSAENCRLEKNANRRYTEVY